MSIEAPLTSVSPRQISERIKPITSSPWITPALYGMMTLNGDLLPWRLRPRAIPMPEESRVAVSTVRASQSIAATDDWVAYLAGTGVMTLTAGSLHTSEMQAAVHSTVFLQWTFKAIAAKQGSHNRLKSHIRKVTRWNLEITPSSGPKLTVWMRKMGISSAPTMK